MKFVLILLLSLSASVASAGYMRWQTGPLETSACGAYLSAADLSPSPADRGVDAVASDFYEIYPPSAWHVPSATAVPEPTGATLAALGFCLLALRRRR